LITGSAVRFGAAPIPVVRLNLQRPHSGRFFHIFSQRPDAALLTYAVPELSQSKTFFGDISETVPINSSSKIAASGYFMCSEKPTVLKNRQTTSTRSRSSFPQML
jgi:hypothetical protein